MQVQAPAASDADCARVTSPPLNASAVLRVKKQGSPRSQHYFIDLFLRNLYGFTKGFIPGLFLAFIPGLFLVHSWRVYSWGSFLALIIRHQRRTQRRRPSPPPAKDKTTNG